MTILCYGEIDLDIYVALNRLPTMERSAWCSEDFENIGGAAANSALWLANWGIPTRLAGHDLGDDRPGDVVRQLLAQQPLLDTRYIACHPGYRSPRCQCLVTPDGERSFITHWPEEVRMTAPSADMLRGVNWLNLDKSGPLPLRLQAAQMAADRGIPVLINDIYEPDNPILPLLDVLVISADIIRTHHQQEDPLSLASQLQGIGDCDVIITNAGGDLTALTRGGGLSTMSPPVVQVVDTTGAGDIFKAGLLVGLLRELPLPEAAKWGAAAGSLMCQYAGTTKTLAPLGEVKALLDRVSLGDNSFDDGRRGD
ncbi:MAG: carbohydrate kinase family protein [Chloroflexi bacterium]|nr:carbohydrate kinase family protein [Chloroflexota bacterium]